MIEDSLVVRRYVCTLLAEEPDFEVLEAAEGLSGLELARTARPDVILTDIQLPGLDGIEIIRAVMREQPCPIVVLSGQLHNREKDMAFEAFDAGAVEVMAKPSGSGELQQERFRSQLIRTVRLMAGVPVIKRRAGEQPGVGAPPLSTTPAPVEIVAIGASTGGPPLLQEMLSSFDAPLAVPLVVVQHIVRGFEDNFARWLAQTGHDVRIAAQDERALPGHVYIAPANADLRMDQDGVLLLTAHEHGRMASTSIDVLFDSVAQHYGPRAWGVLLTGMGTDGAVGLLKMKERGGFTVAQDGATCTIDGMPAAARDLGAATVSLTPDEIWTALRAHFGSGRITAGP